MDEKSLTRKLKQLRPQSAPTNGPLVSIVVTNRDRANHLRRLLSGLRKKTAYATSELVLVDNGSTDESLDLFDRWAGQKRLVGSDRGLSRAATNNQGIRASTSELVLLLSNRIEPINLSWLGFMVQSLTDDVSAVGAMLLYPHRPEGEAPARHPDLSIQHIGFAFEMSEAGVRAVDIRAGGDPLSVTAPDRRDVPAVSGACLLARRSDLLETPFDEHYQNGSEDLDLSLRLGNLGRIVADERAVLFHHDSGSGEPRMNDSQLEQRTRNQQWFTNLWGPTLSRRLRSELTGPESTGFFRSSRAPTVHLSWGADSSSRVLADMLRSEARACGWNVIDGEPMPCDLAIAAAPPNNVRWFAGIDMSVATVSDRHGEWARTASLDAAKRVVVPDRTGQARLEATWGRGVAEISEELETRSSDLFQRLIEISAPRPNAVRIGVSTCAPDWTKAQFWGDTHLARGLMRAFRRLGHETTELIVEDWNGARASSCEVVLHLRGLTRRPVARGQWNLLWIISHPDRLDPGECDDYDIVASASQQHAEQLSTELGRVVHFIPQATDADTFRIGPLDVDYATPVLYVGNSRWPSRRAPRWLMRNKRPFDLYGKNWDSFPEFEYVRRDYIPNHDLAAAYRSASVVVADHHGSMRTNGFIANRLFDVLASGGLVLSDDVAGLPEVFGDLIPTYSDELELERELQALLDDATLRRTLSREGRRIVMNNHTLDHRALQWLELLEQL